MNTCLGERVPQNLSFQCVLFPGGIETCVAALFNSSFLTDPPTFTLTGNTTGGPPTTYTWTRNGAAITANSTFSISIAVNGNERQDFQESRYISTLTVTGRQPGDYQYSTTNRAISGIVSSEVVTVTEGNHIATAWHQYLKQI